MTTSMATPARLAIQAWACSVHVASPIKRGQGTPATSHRSLAIRLRLPGGQRSIGAFHFSRQFLANDRQLGGRIDAEPHAAVTDLHDGHSNLVANQNTFADFSTEN